MNPNSLSFYLRVNEACDHVGTEGIRPPADSAARAEDAGYLPQRNQGGGAAGGHSRRDVPSGPGTRAVEHLK